MFSKPVLHSFTDALLKNQRLLAVLIDPEKFDLAGTASFLRTLPSEVTHLFVGGSTVPKGWAEAVVKELKLYTAKPLVLFPGDVSQITPLADAVLFLSLLSGRNPEYLVGQQVKAVTSLRGTKLEVINRVPTFGWRQPFGRSPNYGNRTNASKRFEQHCGYGKGGGVDGSTSSVPGSGKWGETFRSPQDYYRRAKGTLHPLDSWRRYQNQNTIGRSLPSRCPNGGDGYSL